ncbi:hypothetical protein I4U23_002474 [Adineta vaga]|nr:hypothetical protein I4U23_002474 [Adineta vaga]
MPRLCCFSRRKSKSFSVHEKQRDAEVQKIFIRNVESIRVTPKAKTIRQQDKIKTKSKATLKTNADEIKDQSDQIKNHQTTRSQTSLSKLFIKSKQTKTPSPLPTAIDDKLVVQPSLDVSISTNSDSTDQIKNSKHRSCADSYDLSKDNTSQKKNAFERKQTTGKSKVVLANVKKMIQDQNVQQH